MPSALLERLRVQMGVLLPVVRAFRREFGQVQVDEALARALAAWRVHQALDLHEGLEGTPVERFRQGQRRLAPQIGDALDFEMVEESRDHAVFNIKRCAFAEYFEGLGEGALGHELVCRLDDDIAQQIGEGHITLARAGTIMTGAAVCDFRYSLRP